MQYTGRCSVHWRGIIEYLDRYSVDVCPNPKISAITMHNVYSVHWRRGGGGGFHLIHLEGVQYTGGYHKYTGGYLSTSGGYCKYTRGYPECTGGWSVHRRNMMSTPGRYHDECGGDIMSSQGCLVHQRHTTSSLLYNFYIFYLFYL